MLFHRLALSTDHRILKCFVLVDLKRGEIDHNDIGQMNLYLSYFKKEEATDGDNEPVGILLGAYKDHILVEYATSSITNKVLLAKYQLYLPDKTQLEYALNNYWDFESSAEIKTYTPRSPQSSSAAGGSPTNTRCNIPYW